VERNSAVTEHLVTDEVVERLEHTPDPRLREIMISLVRHLHAFAVDVGLTESEWMQGIQFLTDVGHITDDVRQEFILLSDTLGLSSLVVELTHGAESIVTESTILGPFYVDNPPVRELGANMAEGDPGETLVVSGNVYSSDGTPLPHAQLDVWQTASNGLYDVQDEHQAAGSLRGRFHADHEGGFRFRTVRPVSYPIPDDGPVGKLLASTGRHPWRAAHIHFIVSAAGHEPVITHVFDSSDPYLESDTVFGVRRSLIRTFEPVTSPEQAAALGVELPALTLSYDFTLRPKQAGSRE
jgi:protocatechuate 3,4-dioxygenase beta subunit